MTCSKFDGYIKVLLILTHLILTPSFSLASTNESFDAIYKVKYQDNSKENCLNISSELKGNEKGEFLLIIPLFAKNLMVYPAAEVKVKKTQDDHIVAFSLPANQPLNFTYQVCIDNVKKDISHPIVEQEFFYLMASNMMLMEENKMGESKKVKVDFSELPEKFTVLSSYKVDKKEIQFKSSYNEYGKIIFVGDAKKIQKLNINNHSINLIIKGKGDLFQKNIPTYLEKIVAMQMEFWNEFNFPNYLIMITEYESPSNQKAMSGYHKKNGFIMHISQYPQEIYPAVVWGLSHEFFHAWLGDAIAPPKGIDDFQWFFEGLTDYYGLMIAKKSNLISEEEYISLYNRVLKQYHMLPTQKATNQEIAKNAYFEKVYNTTAKLRGHIVFKQFIARDESKNTKLLDNALKEVYLKYSQKNAPIMTEEGLDFVFAKHLGPHTWREMKSQLYTGKKFEILPDLFKKASLVTKPMEAPSFGFEIKSFMLSNIIKGIDPKSNAYSSGLRDGQKVLGSRVNYTDADMPASILINDQRVIKFQPEKVEKMVPQYEFARAAT